MALNSSSARKGGKLLQLIHYRIRVTITDSRSITGQMLAYDKHMNIVLGDAQEFRTLRKKPKSAKGALGAADEGPREVQRSLGLIILRGENIVSISVEGPPPAAKEDPVATLAPGVGRGAPAGRGMGMGTAARAAPAPFAPPGMPGMPPGMPGAPPGFAPGPPPGFGGGFNQPPPGFAPPPGFGQ